MADTLAGVFVFSHTAAALVGAPDGGLVAGKLLDGQSVEDGGLYRVAGTVAVSGTPETPVARRVRLIDTLSGRLAYEQFSTPTGNYSFDNVRAGPWTVLSHDHTLEYNAVVADNIIGVPM